MDFRHLIVTCLFSMLRLSFETQKIKENYAIFFKKDLDVFFKRTLSLTPNIRTFFLKCLDLFQKQQDLFSKGTGTNGRPVRLFSQIV